MKLLKLIIKLWKSESLQIIVLTFIIWRISLFLILSLAIVLIPLYGRNFLGGGIDNYLQNPYIFAWANFDGEHYLSIAQRGYENLNHSFFPLYPLLIKILSFVKSDITLLTINGLIISNVAFLLSLLIFKQLIKLDYSDKISQLAIVALVIFPTSFYFGAVYTEGLFLFLILASFYCARVKKWWLAGVLGGLASVTRVTGIFLLPALLLEWWQQKNNKLPLPIIIIPLGLISYMLFLYQTTGSFFTFYQELSIFGVQRSGNFITLPQVFYRYLNMLFTVNPANTIYWTIILELIVAAMSIVLLIWGYIKKIRLSYLLFSVLSFILPTLTGSFSSLPRYLLVIFPIFLILALLLSKKSLIFKSLFFSMMGILLIIEIALFLRGYWVA